MRHLYLDHKRGNDKNDGLTKTTAKRSQEALLTMLQSHDTVHADFFEGPLRISSSLHNLTFTGEGMDRLTVDEIQRLREHS